MWNRKRFGAVGMMVAVGFLAAGCGKDSGAAEASAAPAKAASDSPVTITLESYMPALGQSGTDTLDKLVSGFEAANPKIHVEIRPDTATGAANLSAAYQRAAATNDLPDVGQVVFDTLRFAVSSFGAQDLDTVVGKKAVQDLFGGDDPYAKPVRDLAVVDGKTYGIPWTLSTPVLFYNPTLFEQAGLDPADPPATWDEVHEAALAIKGKTGAAGIQVGCVGVAAGGNDWCLQAILGSNGGGVLSADGAKTTFDAKGNVGAVGALAALAKDKVLVDLTTAQTIEQLASGKVAMVLTTSALQGAFLSGVGDKFELKNAAMPGFAGHKATPTNSGSALMMFAKDPAKQQAAWKLMQWLTSADSETTITQNVGYPPLRPSLADDPAHLKPFADSHPLIAANIAQLDQLEPWQSYPGPNFLQIETLLLDSVSKAIFQGADPAATMKAAQSQASQLLP